MKHTISSRKNCGSSVKIYRALDKRLIVLLILLAMGNSMLSNPRFEWSVIAENFTGPSIIQGVLMTLQLTAISVIFGFAGGTIRR